MGALGPIDILALVGGSSDEEEEEEEEDGRERG
jgi:hypothetical protein